MKLSTRDMILIGLFAALMVVGTFLKIPTPIVPLTFQLFFCIYAGLLLGSFKGALSQLIYVILGLTGLPVFSEGGGPGYVFKPTFGFILGFVVCAFIVGYLSERMEGITMAKLLGISLAGLIVAYVIGDLYMYAVLNYVNGVETSLVTINGWMLLFMAKDLFLVGIITVTTRAVLPVLRKAGYSELAMSKS